MDSVVASDMDYAEENRSSAGLKTAVSLKDSGKKVLCEVSSDGVYTFRGIVYATHRRMCPSSVADFSALAAMSDLSKYGWLCPQDMSHLVSQIGPGAGLMMKEGELCLSVTAPSRVFEEDFSEKLPVMVWLHGGSYLTGGSEDHRYGAERLVKTGNVVVVKVSYRLGALGYLYLPDCGSVNLGMGDQLNALSWIESYISEFGGDRENITVFGQSAGAHSIASMIAATAGVPPFKKAILQSPPLGIVLSPSTARAIASDFLRRLRKVCVSSASTRDAADAFKRMDDYDVLLYADVDSIIAAQTGMRGRHWGLPFMPVFETERLQESSGDNTHGKPLSMSASVSQLNVCKSRNVVWHSMVSQNVKVLLSYNADDASPYARKFLGHGIYRSVIGRSATYLATAAIFRNAAESYASYSKKIGADCELFRFDWYPSGNEMRCCHSIELPFLLGKYEDWKSAQMLQGMTGGEYDSLSEFFLHKWTEFAKS